MVDPQEPMDLWILWHEKNIPTGPQILWFHWEVLQVQVQKKEPSGLARLEMERDGGRTQWSQQKLSGTPGWHVMYPLVMST